MDLEEEDHSARVLLRKVLRTELPRTPVTRSASRPRRSLRKRSLDQQNPGSTLRRKLKQKLHEKASQSPAPPPQKRLRSTEKRQLVTPSALHDENVTPRALLRRIIQSETDTSLLTSERPAPRDPSDSGEAERSSLLSDLTLRTEPLTHVVRGLSRRKPQRGLSVSTFEREMDQTSDQQTSERLAPRDPSDSGEAERSSLLSDLTLRTEPLTHVVRGLSRRKPQRGLSVSTFEREMDQTSDQQTSERLAPRDPSDSGEAERSSLLSDLTLRTEPLTHVVRGLSRRKPQRGLSVSAFEREMDQTSDPRPDHTGVREGQTLEDSTWQKLTQGLNDATELYVQPTGYTIVPEKNVSLYPVEERGEERQVEDGGEELEVEDGGEELEVEDGGDELEVEDGGEELEVEDGGEELEVEDGGEERQVEESGEELEVEDGGEERQVEESGEELEVEDGGEERQVEENQELGLNQTSDVPLVDANLQPNEASTSQDEDEGEGDVVPPSQDEAGNASLAPEDDVAFAPTQPMAQAVLTEEDTALSSERVSRRAHRSESRAAVSALHTPTRVTKSLGGGPNPREKELFVGEDDDDDDDDDEDADEGPADRPPSPQGDASTHDQDEANQSEHELPGLANQSPAPAEDDDEEEEDDGSSDDELSVNTPAFVREKVVRRTERPIHPELPNLQKDGGTAPLRKPPPRKRRDSSGDVLPRSYVMSVFRHFAKTRVSDDVFPVLNEILKKFLKRMGQDLDAYATHAKRNTIEMEDFHLLLRRQGFVTDDCPLNVLIEKFLPMEYRKLLIPCATSGNKVLPEPKRRALR